MIPVQSACNQSSEVPVKHSSVVGGSTAKRLINCPGSAALVASVPPAPSSKYADEGTLLHNAIAECLELSLIHI